MKCLVYKSRCKDGAYLYVQSAGDISSLPVSLRDLFGEPEYVMELELTLDRHLANADAGQVMECLEDTGYYLQLPPANRIVA